MIRLWKRAGPLLREISRKSRMLLLLDFDGTLCEIMPRPGQARLSAERRDLLRRLNAGPRRLAILTGRSLSDLKGRVAIPGLIYCGNFGLQMEGPRAAFQHPWARAYRRPLGLLRRRLVRLLGDIPGVLVESKGLGLALHYRSVPPERLPEFKERLARFRKANPLTGLRWKGGRRAWEVLPDLSWDKADAALLLWRRLGRPYLMAIGDGRADEGLFQVARGRGISISVGRKQRSAAAYRLKDVADVYRFLVLLSSPPKEL